MKLIGPGSMLKCIRATECDCGSHRVTEGALYTCETLEVVEAHARYCGHIGCTGVMVLLKGKPHPFCECCFRPLDDGDTSLVVDEEAEEQHDRELEPAL